MAVLLTGAAGFIGSHVGLALLSEGRRVIGLDNLNDYYDPALKQARLARLEASAKPTWALPLMALGQVQRPVVSPDK